MGEWIDRVSRYFLKYLNSRIFSKGRPISKVNVRLYLWIIILCGSRLIGFLFTALSYRRNAFSFFIHNFFPLQDFALDPEESRMRAAARHMVRFMTAGMALITCREPLLISINNNLRSNFLAALRVSNTLLSWSGRRGLHS